MKRKFDAYEMNDDPTLNRVMKCGDCDFKAVKAQFIDENKCPSCGCIANRQTKKKLDAQKAGRW